MEVLITNLTRGRIDMKFVENTALSAMKGEAGAFLGGREAEVSIVLVGSDRMRRINAAYRKHDCVTDVLSFAQDPNDFFPDGQPRMMGELIICPEQVKKDAKESGVDMYYELAWVVVHGILHLFGYEHEKGGKEAMVMRYREETYLSKIKSLNFKAEGAK